MNAEDKCLTEDSSAKETSLPRKAVGYIQVF